MDWLFCPVLWAASGRSVGGCALPGGSSGNASAAARVAGLPCVLRCPPLTSPLGIVRQPLRPIRETGSGSDRMEIMWDSETAGLNAFLPAFARAKAGKNAFNPAVSESHIISIRSEPDPVSRIGRSGCLTIPRGDVSGGQRRTHGSPATRAAALALPLDPPGRAQPPTLRPLAAQRTGQKSQSIRS